MEMRKIPQKDLEKKRPMFFNIGLMLSLALVLAAFEWKTAVSKLVILEAAEPPFEDIYEMPLTSHPPPPPPPVQQPVIIPVADDQVIEELEEVVIDVDIDEYTVIEEIIADDEHGEEIVEAPVNFASQMPEPVMGLSEYYKDVAKQIKYPSQARRMGVEGKVFVQFVVNKDGSISDIATVKGIGYGCDEEAVRVLSLSPKWKPGKQGDRRVRVKMILPIHFRLN